MNPIPGKIKSARFCFDQFLDAMQQQDELLAIAALNQCHDIICELRGGIWQLATKEGRHFDLETGMAEAHELFFRLQAEADI